MSGFAFRRFADEDAQAVLDMITRTLRVTNIKDYTKEHLEGFIGTLSTGYLMERGRQMHFYVYSDGSRIACCGAVGEDPKQAGVIGLFTIFVAPEFQGRGIGRALVEMLERDGWAMGASRIEAHASITGCPFYKKLGYTFMPGGDRPDDEQLLRMEKRKI